MKALRQLERIEGKFTHWAVQYMDARRDGSTVFTTWAGVVRKKGGSAQGCFGECVGMEEALVTRYPLAACPDPPFLSSLVPAAAPDGSLGRPFSLAGL